MDINEIKELLAIVETIKQSASSKAIESISLDSYCSPTVGQLSDAMAAAQGAYKPLVFNRRNAETKEEYADLEAIIEATREALSLNKVFFTQMIYLGVDGEYVIHTRIQHGEEHMESKARVVPVRDDPRTTDSLIQYAKRQSAMSLLGIAGKNDTADDDGIKSLNYERQNFEKGTRVYEVHTESELLSKDQIDELAHELDDSGYADIVKDIYKNYRVEALSDLPRSKYREIIDKVRKIKALRAGLK